MRKRLRMHQYKAKEPGLSVYGEVVDWMRSFASLRRTTARWLALGALAWGSENAKALRMQQGQARPGLSVYGEIVDRMRSFTPLRRTMLTAPGEVQTGSCYSLRFRVQSSVSHQCA